MINIEQYFDYQKGIIENELDGIIPEENKDPWGSLYGSARYALFSGGKRLRPILALAVNETLGGDPKVAVRSACALELIHTYSMIHDDLPCMDDDDFRRGIPTLHKQYSEAQAVLTGDYLLTEAFGILANDCMLEPEQKVSLIRALSSGAGGEGMIAGQFLDMQSEDREIPPEQLQLIHSGKTGAMIRTSIEFGGILAKASKRQMEVLRKFGGDIGLAFQVVDDLLDVTSSIAKHGRAVASDVMNKKATYVSVLGVEKTRQEAHRLLNQAKSHLGQLDVSVQLLLALSDKLVLRTI